MPVLKWDFPYNPIVGMGCFDHQSYDFREGSGFLGLLTHMVDVFRYFTYVRWKN